jgi:hypothetical protein
MIAYRMASGSESLLLIEEDSATPVRGMIAGVLSVYATCGRPSGELKWTLVPPHIAHGLPWVLPEEFVSNANGDLPPGQWMFLPNMPKYRGIGSPARAKGPGRRSERCGRFIKMTSRRVLNKHIGTEGHAKREISPRDAANTRRYRFTNALPLVAHGSLPYEAGEAVEWWDLAGFEGLHAPCARTVAACRLMRTLASRMT